jgi:V/A-type H+-transporting ATPase subunit K
MRKKFLILLIIAIIIESIVVVYATNNNDINATGLTNNMQTVDTSKVNNVNGIGLLAVALSTGLACIGAGIAVAVVASSAVGAISEKPELLGRTIIFVGLAEGIAIYGLIISIMILNKI